MDTSDFAQHFGSLHTLVGEGEQLQKGSGSTLVGEAKNEWGMDGQCLQHTSMGTTMWLVYSGHTEFRRHETKMGAQRAEQGAA
jgi:hypothetical protein